MSLACAVNVYGTFAKRLAMRATAAGALAKCAWRWPIPRRRTSQASTAAWHTDNASSPRAASNSLHIPGSVAAASSSAAQKRSEEHTSELQSLAYLVCRLLLEKKKKKNKRHQYR